MPKLNQTICWIVTDGTIGMENQCLGLARTLNLEPVIKRVKLRAPWKQFSPFLRKGLKFAFTKDSSKLSEPLPTLLIASGRAGAMASILIRRLTRNKGSSRCFTVQIQNPVIDPSRFDLVATPRHDDLWGENVITTRGSLHRVTPSLLKTEAANFAERFSVLPQPRVAVIVGGRSSAYQFSPQDMTTLVAQLRALSKSFGTGFMITTSRRTGEDNIRILQKGLSDIPHVLWDGVPPNPYYGMLGLADAILVTPDSTNMVSEACSTGKPVYIIGLTGGSDKFRRFHQTLYDDGLTRPFKGTLEKWSYNPLNDPELVANRIRRMMEEQELLQPDA